MHTLGADPSKPYTPGVDIQSTMNKEIIGINTHCHF